jgi:HK97 family phage portal protein
MDLFSFLRGFGSSKKAASDSSFGGNWTIINGGNDGINDRNLLSANQEWVFIAVDKVASAVASVPFKVMKYARNGDEQEVFDGPLVKFLEKPSSNFTGKDFIYLNTAYKELTGNAFWERKDQNINPLIPTSVTPNIDNGKLTSLRYSGGGVERIIPYKDVLHDRYIDPSKPYWGVGKLQKIARWVDTSSFSNEFLRRFFLNGATFGGFIETEEESEARVKLIQAGLTNDHVGVRNSHKIAILPKGAKFARGNANMAEMEMGETDDRYRDKILAAFGVPKTLVGLTTEVNRASAEASEYIFARYTVEPIAKALVEFLNENIAKKLDPTGKTYFAYDEFVPVNREIELKEREIALNKQPYMTVNEVRAAAGLPPVKGGDTIYGNPFQVPLGSPQASPEAPVADDEEDDTPPPAKSRSRAIPAHVRRQAKTESALEKVVSSIVKKMADIEATKDTDEAAHKDFVGRVDGYRDQMEKAVRDFNNRQERQVILDLTSITKAVSKTDLWDKEKEIDIMVDFVTPILGALLTEQAIAEYTAQGFAGEFDSGSAIIKQTVALAAKRLAKSYNNTTAELLKRALNDGIQEGESLAQLTKRVQDIYVFSDQVRAKAVAHTESFYIANKGNLEAYRQSGVVKSQRWYTAEDEMVCPHCNPMSGRIVGVDEAYFKKGDVLVGTDGSKLNLNYRTMDVPPLHTNCRCFIRPELIEID